MSQIVIDRELRHPRHTVDARDGHDRDLGATLFTPNLPERQRRPLDRLKATLAENLDPTLSAILLNRIAIRQGYG